ncbi:hypothetical protein OOZ63_22175 [Paucibacter sp. PLA-PC-4]|uniref:hypothetical protein n=1 Tax=Paucibacter sp. PLA-PC-4 TaxID=2993655 RepID=UPI00224B372F|nr:hypothetical protein [Paucibacter sp. PLA-PC-4]MCX2864543.1 hypothetical protein [Paucibacter sp. PLA-PC-4]
MSAKRFYGLIELLLVFGAVMAWALWQWWDWRKWRRGREQQELRERPPEDGPPH